MGSGDGMRVLVFSTLCAAVLITSAHESARVSDQDVTPLGSSDDLVLSEGLMAAKRAPQKGSGAAGRLKLLKAMTKARKALAKEKAKPTRANEASVRVAITQVEHLTTGVNAIVHGKSKTGKGVNPRAPVPSQAAKISVSSHPKNADINFPALHLKMRTKVGIDLLSPGSNTQAAWGNTIAKQRALILKRDRKSNSDTMKEFPMLEQVLSKNGRGKGFGKLRSQATATQKMRPSGTYSGAHDMKEANEELKGAMKTPGVVKRAIKALTKAAGDKEKANRMAKIAKGNRAQQRIKQAAKSLKKSGQVEAQKRLAFAQKKLSFLKSQLLHANAHAASLKDRPRIVRTRGKKHDILKKGLKGPLSAAKMVLAQKKIQLVKAKKILRKTNTGGGS